jgi:hypothetical protein
MLRRSTSGSRDWCYNSRGSCYNRTSARRQRLSTSFACKCDTASSWMKLLGPVTILNRQQAPSGDAIQIGPMLAQKASVKMAKRSPIAPVAATVVLRIRALRHREAPIMHPFRTRTATKTVADGTIANSPEVTNWRTTGNSLAAKDNNKAQVPIWKTESPSCKPLPAISRAKHKG